MQCTSACPRTGSGTIEKQTTSGDPAGAERLHRADPLLLLYAMPPKTRKKLGYNWKARQSHHDQGGGRGAGGPASGLREEKARLEDSNALVLPAHRKRSVEEGEENTSKRKRLSTKQRKRLIKVLEAKKKKAKVVILNNAHSTWCVNWASLDDRVRASAAPSEPLNVWEQLE